MTRLQCTVAEWLADPRPVTETVQEFERRVGAALGIKADQKACPFVEWPTRSPRVHVVPGFDGEEIHVISFGARDGRS